MPGSRSPVLDREPQAMTRIVALANKNNFGVFSSLRPNPHYNFARGQDVEVGTGWRLGCFNLTCI